MQDRIIVELKWNHSSVPLSDPFHVVVPKYCYKKIEFDIWLGLKKLGESCLIEKEIIS